MDMVCTAVGAGAQGMEVERDTNAPAIWGEKIVALDLCPARSGGDRSVIML